MSQASYVYKSGDLAGHPQICREDKRYKITVGYSVIRKVASENNVKEISMYVEVSSKINTISLSH